MVSRFLKYLPLALVLASVMAFAVGLRGGMKKRRRRFPPQRPAPTAAPAAPDAPVAVATVPPTPVPAVAAATAAPVVAVATAAPEVAVATAAPEVVAQEFLMAQGDEPNTMYCGETTAVPAVMFGKAFCDNPIDFIQDEASWHAGGVVGVQRRRNRVDLPAQGKASSSTTETPLTPKPWQRTTGT